MPYIPQQAPGNLDTDGLRKFSEEQHREIARAWTDVDAQLTNVAAALGTTVKFVPQTLTSGQMAQARTNVLAALRPDGWTRTIKTSGSGTYTTPTDCKAILVRMVGGGGGGAGGPVGSASAFALGGGGGSGGYCEKLIVSPVATYAYAVGAAGAGGSATNGGTGGNTTFGSLTAGGGTGGSTMGGAAANWVTLGGTGGTASGGDINAAGQPGYSGIACGSGYGGAGGPSAFNGGATPVLVGLGGAFNGNSSSGIGSGGGGGASGSAGSATTGGNGGSGLIVIDEYY